MPCDYFTHSALHRWRCCRLPPHFLSRFALGFFFGRIFRLFIHLTRFSGRFYGCSSVSFLIFFISFFLSGVFFISFFFFLRRRRRKRRRRRRRRREGGRVCLWVGLIESVPLLCDWLRQMKCFIWSSNRPERVPFITFPWPHASEQSQASSQASSQAPPPQTSQGQKKLR